MATSITHTQTRSVVGTLFRVRDVVTATTNGLPVELFVLNADDGTFNRVAGVGDLSLPTSAQSGIPYYRVDTVQRDATVLGTAQEFRELLESRLKQLAVDYDAATASFVGTTTETLTS